MFCMLCVLGGMSVSVYAESMLKIVVDGYASFYEEDKHYFMSSEGNPYIDLREIGKFLDMTYTISGEEVSVSVIYLKGYDMFTSSEKLTRTLKMINGNSVGEINGLSINVDEPPILKNNRVYASLKELSRHLKFTYTMDKEINKIVIDMPNYERSEEAKEKSCMILGRPVSLYVKDTYYKEDSTSYDIRTDTGLGINIEKDGSYFLMLQSDTTITSLKAQSKDIAYILSQIFKAETVTKVMKYVNMNTGRDSFFEPVFIYEGDYSIWVSCNGGTINVGGKKEKNLTFSYIRDKRDTRSNIMDDRVLITTPIKINGSSNSITQKRVSRYEGDYSTLYMMLTPENKLSISILTNDYTKKTVVTFSPSFYSTVPYQVQIRDCEQYFLQLFDQKTVSEIMSHLRSKTTKSTKLEYKKYTTDKYSLTIKNNDVSFVYIQIQERY